VRFLVFFSEFVFDFVKKTRMKSRIPSKLAKACRDGKEEEAKRLIQDFQTQINSSSSSSSSLFYRFNNSSSPLFQCCARCRPFLLELLLQRSDLDLRPPFSILNAALQGGPPVARIILSDPRINIPAFHRVCGMGQAEEVEAMLSDYAGRLNKEADGEGVTPFYTACAMGNYEVVRLLGEKEEVDVNKGNKRGFSPLRIACEHGHVDVVRYLAGNPRVKVNQGTEGGETPFRSVCCRGNAVLVRCLLQNMSVDVNSADAGGQTPFLLACVVGSVEVAKVLAADRRVDINRRTSRNHTPLWAAAFSGELEIVRIILASQNLNSGMEVADQGANLFEEAMTIAKVHTFDLISQTIERYRAAPEESQLRLKRELCYDGWILNSFFFSPSFSFTPFFFFYKQRTSLPWCYS